MLKPKKKAPAPTEANKELTRKSLSPQSCHLSRGRPVNNSLLDQIGGVLLNLAASKYSHRRQQRFWKTLETKLRAQYGLPSRRTQL